MMYCPQCGAANIDNAGQCMRCGTALPVAGPDNAAVVAYSGFWRRLAASLIDNFVIWAGGYALVIAAILVLGATAPRSGGRGTVWGVVVALLCLTVPWLYFALMESSGTQATLGKLAVGIKVTDLAGQRIGFGRATGRYWGKWISQLILYIGYIMAAFTARRQALHDIMARTVVPFRNPPLAAGLVPSGGGQPIAGWAIALIILASCIPVSGILAAIAIPAYMDYSIRGRVAHGLTAASVAQTKVTANIVDAGAIAEGACLNVATWAVAPPNSPVASLDCDDGTGTITVTMNATARSIGFALVPTLSSGKAVTWLCEVSSARDNRYVPSECRR